MTVLTHQHNPPLWSLRSSFHSSQAPFEVGALFFIESLINEHPRLELLNWSRLPYLSVGNSKRTHFVLDMALMSFKLLPPGSKTSLVNNTLAYKQEVKPPSVESSVESIPSDSKGSVPMCEKKRDDKVRMGEKCAARQF